jgi:hypothetical protein
VFCCAVASVAARCDISTTAAMTATKTPPMMMKGRTLFFASGFGAETL